MTLNSRLSRRDALKLALSVGAASLVGCSDTPIAERPLTFWTLALSPYFDTFVRGRIAAFEALHPGLRVHWVDVPYEALERKLVTAAAAGRAPDVVNTPDLSFARFARAGAFADLDPLLDPSIPPRYLGGAISMCRIGGRLVGLPWYVNPQSLITNSALLSRGGLTPATLPTTWRAILDAAGNFHRATGTHLFSQPLGEESQLPIMMLAEGLPIITGSSNGLRAGTAHPSVLEYLALWRDAFTNGSLPRDAATRGHAHLTDLYQNGKLAAINTGPNFLKRIRDIAPPIFESTTILPGLTGDLGRIHMPVMALSVLASSARPTLAAALAAFMTSEESQLLLCHEAAVMPSTRASLDDPFFTSPATDKLEAARTVAANTVRDAVAFTPALGTWPAMRKAFEEQFKSVLLEGSPLDAAMSRVDEQWNALLAEETEATSDAIPRPAPRPSP